MKKSPEIPASELVLSAIFHLQRKNGVSAREITKYICEKRGYKQSQVKDDVKKALEKATKNGLFSKKRGLYHIENAYSKNKKFIKNKAKLRKARNGNLKKSSSSKTEPAENPEGMCCFFDDFRLDNASLKKSVNLRKNYKEGPIMQEGLENGRMICGDDEEERLYFESLPNADEYKGDNDELMEDVEEDMNDTAFFDNDRYLQPSDGIVEASPHVRQRKRGKRQRRAKKPRGKYADNYRQKMLNRKGYGKRRKAEHTYCEDCEEEEENSSGGDDNFWEELSEEDYEPEEEEKYFEEGEENGNEDENTDDNCEEDNGDENQTDDDDCKKEDEEEYENSEEESKSDDQNDDDCEEDQNCDNCQNRCCEGRNNEDSDEDQNGDDCDENNGDDNGDDGNGVDSDDCNGDDCDNDNGNQECQCPDETPSPEELQRRECEKKCKDNCSKPCENKCAEECKPAESGDKGDTKKGDKAGGKGSPPPPPPPPPPPKEEDLLAEEDFINVDKYHRRYSSKRKNSMPSTPSEKNKNRRVSECGSTKIRRLNA